MLTEICRVERALCVSPAVETIVGYQLNCGVAIVQVFSKLSFTSFGDRTRPQKTAENFQGRNNKRT